MKKMTAHGSHGPYPVYIGSNLRFSLETFFTKNYSAIFIITDENIHDLYGFDVLHNITHPHVYHEVLTPGEQTKSIQTFYHLHTKLLESGIDRESLIIALGGGVVGDISGFLAATFMRGIDYIQMPSTILAHDSSIGGKVAINHEQAKNVIGAFYPPSAVVYDTKMLYSLPAEEIRSGYAELVKEACISDQAFFHILLQTSIHDISEKHLIEHIYRGINIKSHIVAEDEKDLGKRQFLNFGHTFGHALEITSGLGTITHGEAVAIGMLFALYVSEETFGNKLPYTDLQRWMKQNQYPLSLHKQIDTDSLYKQMTYDKKAIRAHINMVLLEDIGKPVLYEIDEKKLKKYISTFLISEEYPTQFD